jgi:hypothetical protein
MTVAGSFQKMFIYSAEPMGSTLLWEQQQSNLLYRPSWWIGQAKENFGVERAYLGRGENSKDSFFQGKIYEFAIYDKYIPKSSMEYLAEDSLSSFAAYVPPDQPLTNVAFQKQAQMDDFTNYYNKWPYANMATNGNLNWPVSYGFHSHNIAEAFWEVDLASGSSSKTYAVHWITLFNREGSLNERIVPMDITLLDSDRNVLHTSTETKGQNIYDLFFDSEFKETSEFKGTGTILGVRFVRVQLKGKNYLHFRELEVYGTEVDSGAETVCNLRVVVKEDNTAPEIVEIPPLRVNERAAPGTFVEVLHDDKWQPATLGDIGIVTDKDNELEFVWTLPTDANNNIYKPDSTSQMFTIFSCSGLLVVKDATIKYDELASDGHKILLTIQVADSGDLSDTAEFTIDVVDINDPPECAEDEITHYVSEGAVAGLAVGGPLIGLCKDPESKPMKFFIQGSTSNNIFDMAEGTGQLQVSNSGIMNYEGQERIYIMAVTVQDSEGSEDTININVVVTDANDPPLILTKKLYIDESAQPGGATKPALSIDDEDGSNDEFTCEINNVWEVLAEGVVGESGSLAGLNGMSLDGKWMSGERVLLEWGHRDTGEWDFWLQFTPVSNIFAEQNANVQFVALQDAETNSPTLSGWIGGDPPFFCIAAAGNARVQTAWHHRKGRRRRQISCHMLHEVEIRKQIGTVACGMKFQK